MSEANDKQYAFNGIHVKIMGRNELEELSRHGFADGTYVISITDADAPLVRLTHKPAGILRMVFDDVGNDEFPISCHVMEDADAEDLAVIDLISNPITSSQGKQIAQFINDNLAKMNHLICQCEMGQSRSAAVAAAVIDSHADAPCDIFDDSRYWPNRLVYHTVLDAFGSSRASRHTDI